MYSHVFSFRFAEALPLPDRLRFAAELGALLARIGARPDDLYWFKLGIDGKAEVYSNTPEVTEAVQQLLDEAALQGLLVQREPGVASTLVFLGRVFSGLGWGLVALVWKRHAGRSGAG